MRMLSVGHYYVQRYMDVAKHQYGCLATILVQCDVFLKFIYEQTH